MEAEQGVLEKIRGLVGARRYRIRLHAVRHMVEEGYEQTRELKVLRVWGPGSKKDHCPGVRERRGQSQALWTPGVGLRSVWRSLL